MNLVRHHAVDWLVGWSSPSLFSTNTAISETTVTTRVVAFLPGVAVSEELEYFRASLPAVVVLPQRVELHED